MKRLRVRQIVFLISVVIGCLISGCTFKASAQICAGSSVRYLVRDTKGVEIRNPEEVYQRESPWLAELEEVSHMDQVIKGVTPDVMWLVRWRGRGCNFKEPLKAILKLNGKQMNLVFLMPRFSQYESRNFLVDSIPFSAGTFEIDLAKPAEPNTAAGRYGSFYPASRWKKATIDEPRTQPE